MTERREKTREEARRTPLVDVFETNEGVTFQFELPGVTKDDVSINVDRDTLRVSSHARIKEEEFGEALLREFAPANFTREFVLSRDMDRENVGAAWRDGVLTLTVPKVAAAKPRKIEITAG